MYGLKGCSWSRKSSNLCSQGTEILWKDTGCLLTQKYMSKPTVFSYLIFCLVLFQVPLRPPFCPSLPVTLWEACAHHCYERGSPLPTSTSQISYCQCGPWHTLTPYSSEYPSAKLLQAFLQEDSFSSFILSNQYILIKKRAFLKTSEAMHICSSRESPFSGIKIQNNGVF